MIERPMSTTEAIKRLNNYRYQYTPKEKKLDKESYSQGHNDGWNACMSYLKAAGKI